jgi:hypothetical protein
VGFDRLSVDIPVPLLEELRDVVWWRGTNWRLSHLVTAALEGALVVYRAEAINLVHPETGELIHKAAGQPYPRRIGSLRSGRTVKM